MAHTGVWCADTLISVQFVAISTAVCTRYILTADTSGKCLTVSYTVLTHQNSVYECWTPVYLTNTHNCSNQCFMAESCLFWHDTGSWLDCVTVCTLGIPLLCWCCLLGPMWFKSHPVWLLWSILVYLVSRTSYWLDCPTLCPTTLVPVLCADYSSSHSDPHMLQSSHISYMDLFCANTSWRSNSGAFKCRFHH